MPKSKTVHVVPANGGWAVKGEGRAGSIHATKKGAVHRARDLAKGESTGQMVIHTRDGRISAQVTYGFPKVQSPPRKSNLGTKNIEKAVSELVLNRLN